jgi:hypothetical protein
MFLSNLLKTKNIVGVYNNLLSITILELQSLRKLSSKWITNYSKKNEIFYNADYTVSLIQFKNDTFFWIYPNCVYICISGTNKVLITKGYEKPLLQDMYIGSTNIVCDNEVHKITNKPKHQTLVLEIKPFK